MTLSVELLGANPVTNSASSLENTRRSKPLRWKLRTERASSGGERGEVDEDSADPAKAIWFFVEAFFFAAARRGSLASKTGSAMTARVFAAGCRPTVSRRNSASAEADGM